MSEHNETEWAKLMEGLDQGQSKMLLQLMPGLVKEALGDALPSAIDRFAERFGLSSEVVGLLHLLAGRSNESYEDTLKKALTLYSYALDARDRGNRLAVLNPDDEIVHEIVGFDAQTEVHQTASR